MKSYAARPAVFPTISIPIRNSVAKRSREATMAEPGKFVLAGIGATLLGFWIWSLLQSSKRPPPWPWE